MNKQRIFKKILKFNREMVLTVLVGNPVPLLASVDLTSVINNLESREKSLASIQFDFQQETEFKDIGNKTTSEGHALFAKAGKLKIVKRTPEEQVTVSNGRKIWVYSPKNEQVWTGPVKSWVKSSLIPPGLVPLSGYVQELKKNFHLSLDEKKARPGEICLVATPKVKDWGYELKFDISPQDWLPNRTIYVSSSGQITTTMNNREINPEIQGKVFEFSAPKGAEVIELN